MGSKNILVSLVAIFAFAILTIASASALGSVTSIKVNEHEVLGTSNPMETVFAGETIPVRVNFVGDTDSSDARVKIWISGARDYSVSTDRFKVFNESSYTKLYAVEVPFNVDPTEDLTLNVLVESTHGGTVLQTVDLRVQRESYIVEVLDVDMPSNVKVGESLPLDIVLKNRGLEFAEDTFVKVSVPALGIETKAYFGDLAPVDQSDPDKEDAVERRLFINVPVNAKTGVYTLELEAYNGDSATTLTKKFVIVGAAADTSVVPSSTTKSMGVGESKEYTLTLVNAGNKVKVYQLVAKAPEGLSVQIDDQYVVIPAGTSKTVKMQVSADKADTYGFTVSTYTDGELVTSEDFVARVQGKASGNSAGSVNTTVVLTVVLAIVFVVLLVVLIVLLTRKPEKQKEFGESYY